MKEIKFLLTPRSSKCTSDIKVLKKELSGLLVNKWYGNRFVKNIFFITVDNVPSAKLILEKNNPSWEFIEVINAQ